MPALPHVGNGGLGEVHVVRGGHRDGRGVARRRVEVGAVDRRRDRERLTVGGGVVLRRVVERALLRAGGERAGRAATRVGVGDRGRGDRASPSGARQIAERRGVVDRGTVQVGVGVHREGERRVGATAGDAAGDRQRERGRCAGERGGRGGADRHARGTGRGGRLTREGHPDGDHRRAHESDEHRLHGPADGAASSRRRVTGQGFGHRCSSCAAARRSTEGRTGGPTAVTGDGCRLRRPPAQFPPGATFCSHHARSWASGESFSGIDTRGVAADLIGSQEQVRLDRRAARFRATESWGRHR